MYFIKSRMATSLLAHFKDKLNLEEPYPQNSYKLLENMTKEESEKNETCFSKSMPLL